MTNSFSYEDGDGTRHGASATYDEPWQRELDSTSQDSAQEVVPFVLNLLQPTSVVDIGCGPGSWLAAFRRHGIEDVFGIDGPWIDLQGLHIPTNRFMARDLSRPIKLDRTFDLAVSLEIAEHLPAEVAPTFVESLTELAPVVLFSAAIPGQGGKGHVNEQWPDYWASLFEARGYGVVDCVRPAMWNNPKVSFWYAQNMLLMIRNDVLEQLPTLRDMVRVPSQMLRLVHPTMFQIQARDRGSLTRQAAARLFGRNSPFGGIARRSRLATRR